MSKDLNPLSSQNWEFAPLIKKWNSLRVCKEWQNFDVFKAWSIQQKWVDKILTNHLINPHARLYSPETSLWVEPKVLGFLIHHKPKGLYPLGVTLRRNRNPKSFLARCGNPFTNETEYLGIFPTPELAHEAWRKRRHELAIQLAETQTNPQIIRMLQSKYAP